MTRDRIVEILRSLGACGGSGDGVPWAESLPAETTAAEAWALCLRGDWLVWLLGELHLRGLLSRQTLVLAVCAAARLSLDRAVSIENRPRIAIETAEAWTRGEASMDQVRAASEACTKTYADAAKRYFADSIPAHALIANAANDAGFVADIILEESDIDAVACASFVALRRWVVAKSDLGW